MASSVSPTAKRKATLFLVAAGAVLWFTVVPLFLGRPPGFLRNLGFASGPQGILLAWCMALSVAALYCAFAVRNIPLVREHWRAISLLKLLGVAVAVPAAIVEEAVFRRMLMDALWQSGWSVAAQVILSGLAFGRAHASWAIFTRRFTVGLGAMVATGTLGTALALVYILANRSLAPVIVAHFVVTATIQPGIMLAAFSGQMRRAA